MIVNNTTSSNHQLLTKISTMTQQQQNKIIDDSVKRVNYCLGILGIITNLICCIILSRKPLIKRKFNLYLLSLAIDELLFCLVMSFNRTFEIISGSRIERFSIAAHLILKISSNIFDYFSIWITLILSIDRYFAIKEPLKIKDFVTNRHPKKLLFITFIITMPFFIIVQIPHHIDVYVKRVQITRSIIVLSHIVYVSILYVVPVIGIIIVNTLLALKLKLKNQTDVVIRVHKKSSDLATASKETYQQSYFSVLIMLAFLAIFGQVISHITYCLNFHMASSFYFNFYKITLILIYIAHTINFFIYFIFHAQFRVYIMSQFTIKYNKHQYDSVVTN